VIAIEAFKYKNPTLLLAVFQVESEFSPTALSNVGAIGLGQIMWRSWGEELKKAGIAREPRDLYEVTVNIRATSFVIETLLKNSGGDIQKTLTAYLGAHQKPYQDKIAYNFLNLNLARN
jgi:soluble lytic murein transglycosylase-like protein